MNCEFCGSTVLPGAKLCAECRSALKRARNEPSSVLQPLAKRANDTLQRRKSRKLKARGDAKAAAVIPPPVESRRGVTPALVAALAAAFCVIGYVILQHREDGARADPAITATVPAAGMANQAASSSDSTAAWAPLASIASPVAPEIEPMPDPAHKAKRARPKKPPPPVVASPAVEVAPQIVQPAPPPVAEAKPPPPPDRRTRLRRAFAKCSSNNDALGRAYCEQRARLDLCEGLWGSVPQCPAARDYGS